MLEEYKKRPDDFSRQIVAEGNLKDIRKIASRVGSKHSENAKKKMSESRKNNPMVKELASRAGKISAEKRRLKKLQETGGLD
jgi:hypothetical protein